MENQIDVDIKKISTKSIIMLILAIIAVITVGTFAWLTYRSNDTAMVLTIGDINGMSVTLKPYQVTASLTPTNNYATQKYVDVSANNQKTTAEKFRLYYQVDSIDSALINNGFKYTIVKSTNNWSSQTVVKEGNFSTASSGNELEIYKEEVPGNNTTYQYKVYLWIDSTAGNQASMQGKVFKGELRAEIIKPKTVYTVNLSSDDLVQVGSQIPSTITTYNTPEAAISALERAYSQANDGETASLPFFLKHTVDTDSLVSESYVGFVVTPEMVTANPGMTAGTYYLKGGDDGRSFLDNAKTIYDAFGGVGCYLDGNSGGNPYTTTPSSDFYCIVPGLFADAYSSGLVGAGDNAGSNCNVFDNGNSGCGVADGNIG